MSKPIGTIESGAEVTVIDTVGGWSRVFPKGLEVIPPEGKDFWVKAADLGLNPSNDGKLVRIPIPPLTEERRKQLAKQVHEIAEDHRTAVRNIRRDGNDAIKKAMKDKKIAEDDEKRALDEIQKLTDGEIKKMEDMSKAKEKEVMEIK